MTKTKPDQYDLNSILDIVLEVEPNNTIENAQVLSGADTINVVGGAEVSDAGNLLISFDDGSPDDDVEDLYMVTITEPGLRVILEIFTSDCDLYLIDPVTLEVIDASSSISATGFEEINITDLAPGTYMIGVSIYDPDPIGGPSTSYVLGVAGKLVSGQRSQVKVYNIYRSATPNARDTGQQIATIGGDTITFTDFPPNVNTFYYQTTAVYEGGESEPSNEVSIVITHTQNFTENSLPGQFHLFQNYPNPFNPSTNIKFDLPKTQNVTIKIYNVNGQLIRTLLETNLNAGMHNITWNGTDDNKSIVPSGLYFLSIKAGQYQGFSKLLFTK